MSKITVWICPNIETSNGNKYFASSMKLLKYIQGEYIWGHIKFALFQLLVMIFCDLFISNNYRPVKFTSKLLLICIQILIMPEVRKFLMERHRTMMFKTKYFDSSFQYSSNVKSFAFAEYKVVLCFWMLYIFLSTY